jgi:hypothetical protein
MDWVPGLTWGWLGPSGSLCNEHRTKGSGGLFVILRKLGSFSFLDFLRGGGSGLRRRGIGCVLVGGSKLQSAVLQGQFEADAVNSLAWVVVGE